MTANALPLLQSSAHTIAHLVRTGQVTAREVIDTHLARIRDLNPTLNALTVVFEEKSRELADDVDRRIARGEEIGALAGVPFTIKENIDITWSASTEGWTFLADAVPTSDATIVQRLMAAGAIPIGRGNMPETGLRWDTDNELFGRTLNPWDHDRVPGGSSGGDAVAVATGMTPIALGNDYGGSLRLPAYAAGVCALRPSAGRIPAVTPIQAWPLTEQFFSVNGPLARTIDDLDLAFSLMHGADGLDPTAASIPHPSTYDGVRRVALTRDPLGWGIDPEVDEALSIAADALARAGWEVVEVEPPLIEDAASLWRQLSVTELVDSFAPGAREVPLGAGATQYFLDNASEVTVLETVGDAVVVHVDAEKKLWSVYVVTKEGLFPVRLQIRPDQLDVVLVVVGDEVVVLVPPRKHETVGGVTGADALPINLPILVIVVVDHFEDGLRRRVVVDGAGVTALHGQVRTRAVVRVHAVGFAEQKEGIGLA